MKSGSRTIGSKIRSVSGLAARDKDLIELATSNRTWEIPFFISYFQNFLVSLLKIKHKISSQSSVTQQAQSQLLRETGYSAWVRCSEWVTRGPLHGSRPKRAVLDKGIKARKKRLGLILVISSLSLHLVSFSLLSKLKTQKWRTRLSVLQLRLDRRRAPSPVPPFEPRNTPAEHYLIPLWLLFPNILAVSRESQTRNLDLTFENISSKP